MYHGLRTCPPLRESTLSPESAHGITVGQHFILIFIFNFIYTFTFIIILVLVYLNVGKK